MSTWRLGLRASRLDARARGERLPCPRVHPVARAGGVRLPRLRGLNAAPQPRGLVLPVVPGV
eukprot:854766-Pyramimonas_sp.AAC.1